MTRPQFDESFSLFPLSEIIKNTDSNRKVYWKLLAVRGIQISNLFSITKLSPLKKILDLVHTSTLITILKRLLSTLLLLSVYYIPIVSLQKL